MANVKRVNRDTSRSVVAPSKREFCAQVWQFVHYVEDFMSCKTQFHKPTCKTKCELIKKLLHDVEE